jgi:hypothetical protein
MESLYCGLFRHAERLLTSLGMERRFHIKDDCHNFHLDLTYLFLTHAALMAFLSVEFIMQLGIVTKLLTTRPAFNLWYRAGYFLYRLRRTPSFPSSGNGDHSSEVKQPRRNCNH